jgi:Protein of unknown function (DUF1073)
MATEQIQGPHGIGSHLGTSLEQVLLAGDIEPGSVPGYDTCKTIYLFHPLGAKMTETPIKMAQFLPREITIGDAPDEVAEEFVKQWLLDKHDENIAQTGTLSRVYGISSVALLSKQQSDPSKPLDVKTLATDDISFNVFDPLNTAGSLVLSQNPNAMDYQKYQDIAVNGVVYHRSRTVTLMNEKPIYIAYTPAAYGFVGRSVYQRALYPLKSFVQTMRADDMVARKVGLIIAILKMGNSIANMVMATMSAFKRTLLKIGQTEQVISMQEGEDVKSLDLTNMDGPLVTARKHILENIASASDMPANILKHETFAEGFGEGSEDAIAVANYIEGVRKWLQPCYTFFDLVNQHRAWNDEFIATMKKKYSDRYGDMEVQEIFYKWKNEFKANWPSLIREPESESIGVADVKLKGMIAVVQVVEPILDPENKAELIKWLESNINAMEEMFTAPMELDYEALKNYTPPVENGGQVGEPPTAAKPFSASDAGVTDLGLVRRIGNIEKYLKRHPDVV